MVLGVKGGAFSHGRGTPVHVLPGRGNACQMWDPVLAPHPHIPEAGFSVPMRARPRRARQSRGGPVVASAESSETVPPFRTWGLGFGV